MGEALSGAQDDVADVGGPTLQLLRTLAGETAVAIEQLTAAAHGEFLAQIQAQLGGQVAAVQNRLSGVSAMLAMADDSTAIRGGNSIKAQLTGLLDGIWRQLNGLTAGDGSSGGSDRALDWLLSQAGTLAEAKLNDLWEAAALESQGDGAADAQAAGSSSGGGIKSFSKQTGIMSG